MQVSKYADIYHCTSFVPPVTGRISALAYFGREKGACDRAPEASADQSDFSPVKTRVSAPLAGRNLHLVTPNLLGAQPLNLQLFVVKEYPAMPCAAEF